MLDFNAKPLFAALCGTFLALTACDTPEKSDGTDEYREWQTGQCIGVNTGTSLSGGGKGYGPSSPWDPDDPQPWRTRAWMDAFTNTVTESTERFIVMDFERDGGTEACPSACREAGLDWDDGGGCVAEGRFTVADVRNGGVDGLKTRMFEYFVEGEYQAGCLCAE